MKLEECIYLIDSKYEHLLSQHAWYVNHNYIQRMVWDALHKKQYGVSLHRLIATLEGWNIEGLDIDHKNGNTLDNRVCNLDVVTTAQNGCNRKLGVNNTSGSKGVRYFKGKWVAEIGHKGKQIYLGRHLNYNDAVAAYKEGQLLYHGQYSDLIKRV